MSTEHERPEATFGVDRRWLRQPAAPPHVLEALRRDTPVDLPEEFYIFYAASNGGEGELQIDPGWFALWHAEEILSLNRAYNIAELYPGYFGFGSNGGGELLAFEVTNGHCGRVAMLAFIGGAAVVIAKSFVDFTAAIGRPYIR